MSQVVSCIITFDFSQSPMTWMIGGGCWKMNDCWCSSTVQCLSSTITYHTTRDGSDIENGLAGKAEVRQSAGDLKAKTTELTDLEIVKAWPSNQNPKRFLNPFDQIDLSLPKIGKRWNEFFEKWTSL